MRLFSTENRNYKVTKYNFDSFYSNRLLEHSDFNELLLVDENTLNILRYEFNFVIQNWIVYMLKKLTKISNKQKFFKNLQVIVNLNDFKLNEFNMKLSGIFLFYSFIHLFKL